jgi:hypothetical protein
MNLLSGFAIFVVSLVSSASLACDNISGVYESTDPQIAKRILRITQNDCEYNIQLNNGDMIISPLEVRADNVAYDRSQSNYSQGQVVDPFLPVDVSSTISLRTVNAEKGIALNKVTASGPLPLSECAEQLGPTINGCSFTQYVFSRVEEDSLLETQNGVFYLGGINVPVSIHYRKVN